MPCIISHSDISFIRTVAFLGSIPKTLKLLEFRGFFLTYEPRARPHPFSVISRTDAVSLCVQKSIFLNNVVSRAPPPKVQSIRVLVFASPTCGDYFQYIAMFRHNPFDCGSHGRNRNAGIIFHLPCRIAH